MRRKLVKQGRNALTITLPKEWTKINHLKPRDEVEIEEENGNLIVCPEFKKKLHKQTITINEHSYHLVRRLITNAYKKGIDELKLVFKKPIPFDTINEALSTLTIGYEVTDVGKDNCLIKSFSSEDEGNIKVSIRKCFFLVKEINNIILDDIKTNKFKNKQKITTLDNNIRKLTNYAIRTSVKTIKNPNHIQYNINLFSNLFLFAIKLNYIYLHLMKEKNILPSTKKMLEHLFTMFSLFYDTYYKKSLDKAHETLDKKDLLVKEIDQNIDKGNGKIVLQISMAMRCLHDSTGSLIGLIMDKD